MDPDGPTEPDESGRLPLVLASASPRRAELLSKAGICFEVQSADVDERPLPDESGAAQALRLARAKADAVAERRSAPCLVLGSDTLVLLDGRALGKPSDTLDALRMLRDLNGRPHEVVTGVSLRRSDTEDRWGGAVTTTVTFDRWPDSMLAAYAATGEGLDKAGAYAIQDGGGALVAGIEGSHSNVIGLPLAETLRWLEEAGGPGPFTGDPP